MSWWNTAYLNSPPWEIGAPQPEIVRLAQNDELVGNKVLDLGCGTCDNALFLARIGFSLVCFDISSLAIEKGKKKASELGVKMGFVVGDALQLREFFSESAFSTVIDSGLFHTLGDGERLTAAKEVGGVLTKNGRYVILCFSDKGIGGEYPRRISQKEIEETFSEIFLINYIMDSNIFRKIKTDKGTATETVKAYTVSMTKK
jgi:ubiquinone/menaquinone biosynthesis C-methylase UbiE